MLRSICAESPKTWSALLPVIGFVLNSTGFTLFYVNGLTHPRVPLTLPLRDSGLDEGELADGLADISLVTVRKQVSEFLATRSSVYRYVRDTMAESQDKQKEQADAKSRICIISYKIVDQVLLTLKIYLPTWYLRSLRPNYVRTLSGHLRSWPRRA